MSRLKSRLNYAQKECVGLAGKLMMRVDMLFPGARVGVAVSGGMDSLVMLRVLLHRQRIAPFPFEIMVLHLNPGFDPANHAPLLPLVRSLGTSAHVELTDHGPRAHSDENRKNSPCFYCAMLRRKRLFDLCARYGLTHLAFGHNADDLASTFFMNMFNNGRVDGLSAKESFFDGRLMVVRPLLLVEKSAIRRAAAAWELPVWNNPCPFSNHSSRLEMELAIGEMTGGKRRSRTNMLNALRRWQLDRDMPGL